MQYDRTGLPRFETVEEDPPRYSFYFWIILGSISVLLWFVW